MKKSLLIAAILGAMAASAEDSWLYWMVGSDAPTYTSAKVRVVGSEPAQYLSLYSEYMDPLGQSVTASRVAEARTDGEGLYASLAGLANPSLASFLVELFNGDTFVGQSQEIAYNSTYVYYGAGSAPAAVPLQLTSFSVPEPNSGLLLLVGCAVLGLRRRRQKKA